MTAEQIVRALAAADPIDNGQCLLCVWNPESPAEHKADCPWRLAVEWVASREAAVCHHGSCGEYHCNDGLVARAKADEFGADDRTRTVHPDFWEGRCCALMALGMCHREQGHEGEHGARFSDTLQPRP